MGYLQTNKIATSDFGVKHIDSVNTMHELSRSFMSYILQHI